MKKKIKKLSQVSPYSFYEVFRDRRLLKRRFTKQENLFRSYGEGNSEIKLHIGCGANFLEGWLNTDIDDSDERIAYLDAGEEFPLSTESFDFIFSEHLFEHLNVEQQVIMLRESLRILKPNGIMRIATPSLGFLNRLYNNPDKELHEEYIKWAVETSPYLSAVKESIKDESKFYCYVINNFYKAWGHKMIHNFDSIYALAIQSGYSECKIAKVHESSIKAFQNIEKHGTVIPEKFNILETMVVELKK
ncbi:class I SAM-dependent methyltransferase [Salinimicrobium sp. WS361]|uniref:class I SAM-dependent methyltransferase n=1 Tax=Salinimicrobium sp. WS361 TaxID=3425123 RepID=UPI003D6E4865